MGTTEAPLRTMDYREVFQKFCEGETSFRSSLLTMLEKLDNNEVKKDDCIRLFWKAADVSITDTMTDAE